MSHLTLFVFFVLLSFRVFVIAFLTLLHPRPTFEQTLHKVGGSPVQPAVQINSTQAPAATSPSDRRVAVRQVVRHEALSRPLELVDGICWGAVVRALSTTGLGLVICFPFKLGAHLAVDVRGAGKTLSLLVRVVRVTDQTDGTWFMGCELVTPLTPEQLQGLV